MTVSCEKVGLDYFDVAPVRFTASEVISATPDEVFAVFLDADSWTKWVFAIGRRPQPPKTVARP